MSKNQFDYLFKLLLIGDSDTGKSSILLQYSDGKFETNYITTIGIDFKMNYTTIDNKKIKTQIWDTAGQERFRTITTAYYRGAHGIVLVYDVTNKRTFDNVSNWMSHLTKHVQKDAIIFVVGNKCDDEDKRCVTYEEGLERATAYDCKFFETSAKTGLNISSTFSELIYTIYNSNMVRPQCEHTDMLLIKYADPKVSSTKWCNI